MKWQWCAYQKFTWAKIAVSVWANIKFGLLTNGMCCRHFSRKMLTSAPATSAATWLPRLQVAMSSIAMSLSTSVANSSMSEMLQFNP
jgi:hypothetical protein